MLKKRLRLINKWGHYRDLLFFKNRKTLLLNLIEFPKLYYVTSGHGFTEMFNNKNISKLLTSSSAEFLPDGIMSVLMGFIYTKKIYKQIPGWHITTDLLNYANDNNFKVFILGGDENTKSLLNAKCKNLKVKVDFGFYNIDSDFTDIILDINNFNPDVVLVALGAPKQEIIATILSQKIENKLILPIGIAVNMYLGIEREVPQFFKKFGIAWIHRLFLNPIKMFPRVKLIFVYVIKSVLYYSYIKKNIK